MTRWKHTVIRIGRWVFVIAAMAYLVVFAREAMLTAERSIPDLLCASIGETTASVPAFVLAALVSVFGWRALLRRLTGECIATRTLLQVFCSTQIAKYLPGNIGHHIGRVALARTRLGIPATTTTVSILQEGALVVACSLLVGTLCHLVAPLSLSLPGPVPSGAVLVALLVAGFGTLAIVNRSRARIGQHAPAWLAFALRITPSWPAVRAAMPAYTATQLLNGVGVTCIASAMIDIDGGTSILLTGAYSLAWMIGFLLPGAPGGLGVRESAFLVLVAHALSPDVALGITVLSRVGNVAADALVWLAGAMIPSARAADTFPDETSNPKDTRVK